MQNVNDDLHSNKKRTLPLWMVNGDTTVVLPEISFRGKVVYFTKLEDFAATCEEILNKINESSDDSISLGFDIEWPYDFRFGSGKSALIQICPNEEICYLFHVYNLRKLPTAFHLVISHPKTQLVGICIKNDLWKLGRDFDFNAKNIVDNNCIDIGVLANTILNTAQTWNMEKLVRQLVSFPVVLLEIIENRTREKSNFEMKTRRMFVLNAGLIKYSTGLQLQGYISDLVKSATECNTESEMHGVLVLLEHYPVYTVGIRNKQYRKDLEEKLINLGAEYHKTNRGGLITFHGPGQLVAYPIINLKYFEPSIRWYVSQLENTIISLCKNLNITASKSPNTGVWVGDNKICAIGIHGSRFITTHGLALNCNIDLEWFSHITPCGIQGKGVTSLSNELKKEISVQDTLPIFLNCFKQQFNCNLHQFSKQRISELLSDND